MQQSRHIRSCTLEDMQTHIDWQQPAYEADSLIEIRY